MGVVRPSLHPKWRRWKPAICWCFLLKWIVTSYDQGWYSSVGTGVIGVKRQNVLWGFRLQDPWSHGYVGFSRIYGHSSPASTWFLQENTLDSWISEIADHQPAQLVSFDITKSNSHMSHMWCMTNELSLGIEPSEAGPVPTAAPCPCHPGFCHQRRGSGAHCGLRLWRSGRVAWELKNRAKVQSWWGKCWRWGLMYGWDW